MMDRKKLIEFTQQITDETKIKSILEDREGGNSVLGKTQFRSMAEMCNQASTYEEICLMVKYKMAKGNGWQMPIGKNNERCGDVILSYLDRINKQFDRENKNTNSDDYQSELLDYASLFFGYLYWQATIMVEDKKRSRHNVKRQKTMSKKGGRH